MSAAGTSPPLAAREAYPLWAGRYERETVVSALDERAVASLGPAPHARVLLDAGCGTARRLRAAAAVASQAVGVDLVPDMLAAGRPAAGERAATDPPVHLAAGDLRALPLRTGTFDLLWCRLVVGHVADLNAVYAELGRVSSAAAQLVVTDFHPAAAAAGHSRTFRGARGTLHSIVHHVHQEDDHRRAALAAGWAVIGVHHLRPADEERPFYARAGRLENYQAQRALPLVLALCLAR